MKSSTVQHPKNLIVTLALSCLAWALLRFLHSPEEEKPEQKIEKTDQSVTPLLVRD
ncbi:MAG TPA: hypothetical protein VIM89_15555 [Mucilaginibacter sp.]